MHRALNDTTWLLGQAKLNYGGDGEATVIGNPTHDIIGHQAISNNVDLGIDFACFTSRVIKNEQ